ncbi:MAG: ROK family protein [bacterium]|nr:ROK family protein [bacterium]
MSSNRFSDGTPVRGESNYAVVLDVGGTFVKSAVVSSEGDLLPGTCQKSAIASAGEAEVIVGCLAETVRAALQQAGSMNLSVCGIGLCVPGPFDYKAGVSLMIHKFQSIRGLDLRQELIGRLCLSRDTHIYFESDAHAFLLGEAWTGNARGIKRVMAVTLGTGIGAAFMNEGKIMRRDSRTPLYSLWNLPYGEGIVEDRLSRAGITARYEELGGNGSYNRIDVKDIASLAAKERDRASLQVFEEVGFIMGEVLAPVIEDFGAECLVLGGQISKAFPLFSDSLIKRLVHIPTLKKITCGKSIDRSALYGMAGLIFGYISN